MERAVTSQHAHPNTVYHCLYGYYSLGRTRVELAVLYNKSEKTIGNWIPAYCPFFNPIEFMFGYIKKSFQRHYVESSGRNLMPFVIESFQRFRKFNMARVFQHCGWMELGHFDPSGPLSREHRTPLNMFDDDDTSREDDDELGFAELHEEVVTQDFETQEQIH